MRVLDFKVKDPHERLDQYLKNQLQPFSKSALSLSIIKDLIRSGFVYLNLSCCKICSKPLFKGAKLRIYWDHESPTAPELLFNENLILFEDRHLLVVNKPTGLATQSTKIKFETSLYDEVRFFLQKRQPQKLAYLGLIHRIDKPTSGVLLFTKTKFINPKIVDLFEKQKINKIYLAVVPSTPDCNDTWEVKDQLIRAKDTQRGMVTKDCKTGGKKAHTKFKLIDKNELYQMIEAQPLTGRTHQIRFHLAKSELPIVGDRLYGSKLHEFRTLLHAHKLEFTHPVSHEKLSLTAPMPQDMARLFPRQNKD